MQRHLVPLEPSADTPHPPHPTLLLTLTLVFVEQPCRDLKAAARVAATHKVQRCVAWLGVGLSHGATWVCDVGGGPRAQSLVSSRA
eukprot:CAMPEP_0175882618 /NCGR_PEP_ID=MMETSP0107_2-20121207/43517_1 /TAXON_ID=195067 ORGANISM="Goniomonas pacifica, Strain CCMP1869" /NCGR_SAMPLE_ID=MMETSP0107_2 /ASSEMBLY_ACC=CAM_ASM_000203 /LENGTH=85 /DNA_ID=CAMNT_0017202581 /DNA_START=462 /DNA_END=716 /DNA_ORIENTATION=+